MMILMEFYKYQIILMSGKITHEKSLFANRVKQMKRKSSEEGEKAEKT